MPVETPPTKAKIEDFAATVRDQLIPLGGGVSYFASPAMPEEDLRPYIHEPIESLPQNICKLLPGLELILVPYLERSNGKTVRIHWDPVAVPNQLSVAKIISDRSAAIFLAVKDEEIAEYHYTLYNAIASVVAERWTPEIRNTFLGLLRGELAAKTHGEVDERSWHLKQALIRRGVQKEAKIFRDYAKQSFEDTLTLYLHGICCDIDVETGPRQLPSRWVRKRLEALQSAFPPPAGHHVFPEELNRRTAKRPDVKSK